MLFHVGQTVVHPFHGPARIVDLTERVVRGEARRYLTLATTENALSISVPVDHAEEVGLRPVASPERVAQLLDILAAPSTTVKTQWSRRIKDYQERLSTGRIEEACVVIREISRSGPKAPASAEGQMLRTARSGLAIELSLALQITRENAENVIDTALREAVPHTVSGR